MTTTVTSAFREVTPERAEEWVALGRNRRHFFPHRFYVLPKCGPDGWKLTQRMTGFEDPTAMRELVLYADPATLDNFPRELFFDDDIVWHQQQFGLPGQVASANLVLDGDELWSMVHLSDLVQRISRRRDLKTRVEKRFKGWVHMLLNAVMALAAEHDVRRVRTPSSALALRHTDPERSPQPSLYERIYDRTPSELYRATRDGEWWSFEVAEARVVVPERRAEERQREKVICICHDLERGLGHVDYDPALAREMDARAPRDFEVMREVEAELGVRATYCVVGKLLEEVRGGLERDGHCLAFHSYDHSQAKDRQLDRCRELDYRLKGYRPPRSEIAHDDTELLFHNFEWLASSAWSLGVSAPELRAGLVRMPIVLDDFDMWRSGVPYERWERQALGAIADSDFTAIDLHDCYASYWLPHYRGFLEQVAELGELRTLDEVAADLTLASAS
jgi:hypothetical protein